MRKFFQKDNNIDITVKFDKDIAEQSEYFCNSCGEYVKESHFTKQGRNLICNQPPRSNHVRERLVDK